MRKIIFYALLLSVLSSIMFLFHDIGISVFIFFLSLIFLTHDLLRTNHKINNKKYFLLSIPIILLASTYFLFQNEIFRNINLIVIILLFIIMLEKVFNGKIKFIEAIYNGMSLIVNPIDYLGETKEEVKNTLGCKNKIINWNIIKAILIPIPIIIIVIILLSKSESLFEYFLLAFNSTFNNALNFNIRHLIIRILFIFFIGSYLTIFFYHLIFKYKKQDIETPSSKQIKDNLTLKVLMISLNIVYLIYVILQLSTLINYLINGGISNYAEYARSGFFELMAVSFLNIGISIYTFQYKDKNNLLNILNTIMLSFTFILVIAAFFRMRFYEIEFGYTMLRLLVYAILVMEGIIILPTIIYVWKRNLPLITITITIILTGYITINFINLDYIIAKENINRYFRTGKIDIEYLVNDLSLDAYSQIIRLETSHKEEIEDYKRNIYFELTEWDNSFWAFNASKEKVKNNLKDYNLMNKYKVN